MELAAVILMLAIGVGLALAVTITFAAAQRESSPDGSTSAPDRDRIAASILYNILLAGGVRRDDAFRDIRRKAGLAAPVTGAIDVTNWGERFAQIATPEQRSWLLETAVQLIAATPTPVPLRQYTLLLDLSFALGFQTDALARLRERYGFEYVDHAKDARPREADRGGGAMSLFVRETRDPGELLRILGIEEASPSRPVIISAYRRLAAQHHPDRFFGQPAEVQAEAAARFIEITRAYEALLTIYE